mmetsp:Transcript_22557/g.45826  ORF Transcript_22557/g.45826 Transcript_22557/m.45826 type:complete len:185 (+) Transcript_22557:128-682(+)
MQKLPSVFVFLFVAVVQLSNAADIPIQSTKTSHANAAATRLNGDIHVRMNEYHNAIQDKDQLEGKAKNVFDPIAEDGNLQRNEAPDEKNIQQFTQRELQQQTDDEYYEPKPYYGQKSKFSKSQKITLGVIVTVTSLLAIYSCVLHYELSTLNVYSLLGMGNNTEEEDEEKVGDAYMRNDGLELN